MDILLLSQDSSQLDIERHGNEVEVTVSESWRDADDNLHLTEANIYLTKEKARKMRNYLTKFLNT
jgi:hypothetical protein